MWKYDKRFHTSLEDSLRVPAIDTPPQFQAGGAAVGRWVVAVCGSAGLAEAASWEGRGSGRVGR